MSQLMSPTSSHQSSVGRFAVGLALSVGLLLSSAACGDGSGSETSSGGHDPAEVAAAEISVMKVCEMIDLAPLKNAMKAEYADGPKDISKGVGVDPAGAQCYAQIDVDKLRPGPDSNAGLNVAAIPYTKVSGAKSQYDERIAAVKKHLDLTHTETDLKGEWDQGVLINGQDQSTNRVYALVRQENYLLKIEMSWSADDRSKDKFPFTRDDIAASFGTMMTPFYTAVSKKAEG